MASGPPTGRHRHPIIAGALAGGAEVLCTYPLEFIKTQLQMSGSPFTGSLDCARRTVTLHGFKGLYRGLSSNLLFSFPRTATRFYIYESVVHLPALEAWPPAARTLCAGAAAGVVEAAVAVIPMTTLQVRLVADQNRPGGPRYAGLAHAARTIWREEGPAGLYLGAGPTLLKITFNVAGRFLLYERLTVAFNRAWDRAVASSSPLEVGGSGSSGGTSTARFNAVSMAAGGLAGALTVVANHPVDAVKTNMQCAPPGHYASAAACARQLVREGGIAALYRGLAPRLNRVVLETALSFTFYQHLSALCDELIDGRGPAGALA